ncbi:MAG: prepilin-type N-terminal cleavage/methylation domain-containing protein [Kiritimatiellia bacterium]
MKLTASKTRRGHTLLETIVAMTLLTVVMGMATAGWLYMVRGEKRNSTQAELDVNVRKTIEQLRSRLRLSALEKVVFYRPPGEDNYTAVSFPLAEDSDGDGLIELENGTNIIWDKTVIYHVWNKSPEQLLCTTFSPRSNLTDAQLREQLAYVVTNGKGEGTYNGANAKTTVLFENLFDWKLWPKGSRFDAYSTTQKRELVPFGSVVIPSGVNTLSFRVTGKNQSSTGYGIGLDYLRASPSGSDREAEWQAPGTLPSGLTVTKQFMSQGSWSDNYQLYFQASAVTQQVNFAIENDCWEENTFRTLGTTLDGVSLKRGTFGSTLEENYISMDGFGTNWYSAAQAANPTNAYSAVGDDEYNKCAVRVLMKGANIQDGGFISANGQYPQVMIVAPPFHGGSYKKTRIKAISIGLADDSNGYASAMNVKPNTMRNLTLPSEVTENYQYAYCETMLPFYQISRTNTYAVTFYIEAFGASDNGAVAFREDPSASQVNCYVLSNATTADVYADNWSSKANLITSPRIPCVECLHTQTPPTARFTSGIFDTTKDDPAFREILWNQPLGVTGSGYTDTPGNTAIRFKVRSGDDPFLADAPPWTNVPVITASGSSLESAGSGRYIQFQADFTSDVWSTPQSPSLRNVTIRWPGDTKLADISVMLTRGTQYGEFEVLLNGTNLYKGVRIDLTIFKDITSFGGHQERMTSSMMAEIEPRNTGK